MYKDYNAKVLKIHIYPKMKKSENPPNCFSIECERMNG